jgi:hypothetical protein
LIIAAMAAVIKASVDGFRFTPLSARPRESGDQLFEKRSGFPLTLE